MKVIITAGGTGGHIYPAISIINKIKEVEPDSDFIYIGTHNRMEKDIIPEMGIKYVPIEIYGLSTSLKLMKRNIKNVFLIKKAVKKCMNIINEFKPDIVIGVGGYVTYPVVKAANKCGVKVFLHEQNSIPGKSNRTLAKYADIIGISFEDSRKYFKHDHIVLTGNPCSENALKIDTIHKEEFGLLPKKKSVLIFNGSLGSSTINAVMEKYLNTVKDKDYQVLFVTGKSLFDRVDKSKMPDNVKVVPYVNNLSGLMKDMDLIIGRAGASSIAELTALGIPCILIPSPYVANNHQYYNAMSIKNAGGCEVIEEKDITPELVSKTVDKIINDDELCHKMSNNLKELCISNSSTLIYEEIKKII